MVNLFTLILIIYSFVDTSALSCEKQAFEMSSEVAEVKALRDDISKVIIPQRIPSSKSLIFDRVFASIRDCETLKCVMPYMKILPVKFSTLLISKFKREPLEVFIYLKSFASELSKAPSEILKVLIRNNYYFKLTLLGDRELRPPRDWSTSKRVVGFQDKHRVVIAIDSLYRGHGSQNLVLHELFHLWEYQFYNRPSLGSDFSNHIHESEKFYFDNERENAYYRKYPDEALAESFARYFHKGDTQNDLKESNPKTYEFINKLDWKNPNL